MTSAVEQHPSASSASTATRASVGDALLARELAVLGGPRTVTERGERWRRIRVRDIYRIAREAWNQNATAITGRWIADFERRFSKLTDTRHALLMNSGTSTLHSAYFAAGVKPGDEVIVPTYTFFAAATPILQCGGTPVFCDIDERTLTADPDDVEARITARTRAICVVHLWGNPARIDRFAEIARKHNITLIEDCSHAHGATFKGRPIGSWGDIGCFSLQGQKPVSGGELGVAVTNNDELYDRMLMLGHFGRIMSSQQSGRLTVGEISLGVKYRPHLYGVILACGGLDRLPELNRGRRANWARMCELLSDVQALRPFETYPDAQRGGILEFMFRYYPEHAGGWTSGAFATALAAEGAPFYIERFTNQDWSERLLHQTLLFTEFDGSTWGGCMGRPGDSVKAAVAVRPLPVAERLADRLIGMDALVDVDDRYLVQCAEAVRKVARIAASGADLRG